MTCPKCKHPRQNEEAVCAGCGLIFAKWEAKQQRLAEAEAAAAAIVAPPPVEIDTAVEEKLTEWTQYWARCAAILLGIGFFSPLFKHSMLAGESYVVWPWQLAGLSKDPGVIMALGTYSEGAYPGIWTLVPLLTACLVLLIGCMARGRLQTLAYALTGMSSLLLLLLVFIEENERLGLVFLPPTLGAGIVTSIAITAGALIAAANHASRLQPDVTKPARWAGAGGIVLILLVALFMIGGDGPWKAWSMWGLYGLLVVYALLAVARLFGDAPGTDSIDRLSKLGRALVAWSVIAVIFAQSGDQDGFSMYVTQGGGSTASTIFAAIKGFLIFFGSALVMTIGMAGGLTGQREDAN